MSGAASARSDAAFSRVVTEPPCGRCDGDRFEDDPSTGERAQQGTTLADRLVPPRGRYDGDRLEDDPSTGKREHPQATDQDVRQALEARGL
ncbi:hypothetical protein C482_03724 [Natrialba chahannaoensis JCM 10990]|uniref:Uncharacterized protein n=1 Tax=Natrialba chahannaoensis JCM 10990 TaxID=1227492 RepID=M0AYZ4_9EURY|nr:hypothetical protein [Natrialba chahannaoensis]ELZ03512.1 hypothetical protein C482_03724 [Natrialba chahannaoensis JCM 10990]